MVEKTGSSASRKLYQMALDAHLRQRRLEQQASSEASRQSDNDSRLPAPLVLPGINILGLETSV